MHIHAGYEINKANSEFNKRDIFSVEVSITEEYWIYLYLYMYTRFFYKRDLVKDNKLLRI